MPVDRHPLFRGQIAGVRREVGAGAAEAVHQRQFVDNVEPAHAAQRELNLPAGGFLETGNAAGAADAIERGAVGRAQPRLAVDHRLDDADQPPVPQRVLDHVEITRLEHVQRQAAARQQQDAVQRKQGQFGR